MNNLLNALWAYDRGQLDRDQLLALGDWKEAPISKRKIEEITKPVNERENEEQWNILSAQ